MVRRQAVFMLIVALVVGATNPLAQAEVNDELQVAASSSDYFLQEYLTPVPYERFREMYDVCSGRCGSLDDAYFWFGSVEGSRKVRLPAGGSKDISLRLQTNFYDHIPFFWNSKLELVNPSGEKREIPYEIDTHRSYTIISCGGINTCYSTVRSTFQVSDQSEEGWHSLNLTFDERQCRTIGSKFECKDVPLTLEFKNVVFISRGDVQTQRIGGINRYETAALIAEEVRKQADVVDTILLTTGQDYPDAVVAGSWPANGVILLTLFNSLPEVTRKMLQEPWVKNVVIFGGTSVVSQAVQAEIEQLGLSVQRIAGPNRFQTSIEVTKAAYPNGGVSKIWLASGYIFQDQLLAAAGARTQGGAMLLLPPWNSSLREQTLSEIERLTSGQQAEIHVIDEKFNLGFFRFKDQDVWMHRGDLNKRTFSVSEVAKSLILASSENWPDALGGTRLLSQTSTLVLTTPKCIDENFTDHFGYSTNRMILGGRAALEDGVLQGVTC